MNAKIRVIIPAFNEEPSVQKVICHIPQNIIEEIIVVNNGSTDNTAAVAKEAGVSVLNQPKKGYGNACLKGISYVEDNFNRDTDIIVFLDADFSDYPEETTKLIDPIIRGKADLVIGSRALGEREKGSMTFPQVFGNWLATRLLRLIYGIKFTDLGPFRAINWEKLKELQMEDKNFGWTVEMQIKAAKKNLKCVEVPVNYKNRIGKSKVSGTIKGTFLAGYKILWTIFKYI